MTDHKRTYIQWWMVPGAISLLLLAFNAPWFRMYFRGLYRPYREVYSLAIEMNFAVWWAAMIYLLSAALFFEIASGESRNLRRAYLGLSLLMLAMVIDEIGTFHEWASGLGGWTVLAPFGLFGVLLLADSLRRLWREGESKAVIWLLLIGFLVMGSVVIQEYFEHNVNKPRWNRRYGRFIEESTEMLGAWIILIPAVFRRQGGSRWGGPLRALVPDPTRMAFVMRIVVIGFLAHVLVSQAMRVDVGTWDGSPTVIYASLVFFLLACYAFWVPLKRHHDSARSPEVRGFWRTLSFYFLACSAGTMENLWNLIPGLGHNKVHFQRIPFGLAIALVTWLVFLVLWRRRDLRLLWLLPAPVVMLFHLDRMVTAGRDLSFAIVAGLSAVALLRSDSWACREESIE